MKEMGLYEWIALIIVIIGGINWCLVGLFHVDLISDIFGAVLGRLIFIIVGIAALYLAYVSYGRSHVNSNFSFANLVSKNRKANIAEIVPKN